MVGVEVEPEGPSEVPMMIGQREVTVDVEELSNKMGVSKSLILRTAANKSLTELIDRFDHYHAAFENFEIGSSARLQAKDPALTPTLTAKGLMQVTAIGLAILKQNEGKVVEHEGKQFLLMRSNHSFIQISEKKRRHSRLRSAILARPI